jgi:hypothetical protein
LAHEVINFINTQAEYYLPGTPFASLPALVCLLLKGRRKRNTARKKTISVQSLRPMDVQLDVYVRAEQGEGGRGGGWMADYGPQCPYSRPSRKTD